MSTTAPEAAPGAAAAVAAVAAVAADAPAVSQSGQAFRSCWSCRVLSGGGLLLSAAARKVMRGGGPTSMGTVAQLTFAASLAAWGVVIIADPHRRRHRAAAAAAVAAVAADAPAVSQSGQAFRSCWSCRVLSGGGLLLSAAYVFSAARKVMRGGGPTSMGTVAQLTFAASLAAWGVVIIADPVGKAQRKT
ncbi:hypothetical protein L3Q82_003054 [Scortum barcoo]|uniref:Uncharacterized protein n=1 Tax=Scortum barcoo TaxID=214431 RepID=A0ACB8VR90_9TELE|nr:hypothetical protein L3Q82_003054 [Scortum barcoo]